MRYDHSLSSPVPRNIRNFNGEVFSTPSFLFFLFLERGYLFVIVVFCCCTCHVIARKDFVGPCIFDYCFRVHLDHNTPHKKLVSLSHYRNHLVFFLVTYAMGNVNYTYLQEHSAFVFQKSVILKRKNWVYFLIIWLNVTP